MSAKECILIIGANGQIGSELTMALRKAYGSSQVVASDIKTPGKELKNSGPFEMLDVGDRNALHDVVRQYGITQIYHLAAVLSATAEQNPHFAWDINMRGLLNVLEIAVERKLNRVFWPSSIAVFGPGTPTENTPQSTIMDPGTVYGISKLAGERWCEYYHLKHQLDVRSLRYPGLISYRSLPGGGTTDYAVDIYYEALKNQQYTCFLAADTTLPMMYMPDAIQGTLALMQAAAGKISIRSSYNIASMSFSPEELADEIKKHLPEFTIAYKPDYRQEIASTWPRSIDDSQARKDWGWHPEFSIDRMTADMLNHIDKKIRQRSFY